MKACASKVPSVSSVWNAPPSKAPSRDSMQSIVTSEPESKWRAHGSEPVRALRGAVLLLRAGIAAGGDAYVGGVSPSGVVSARSEWVDGICSGDERGTPVDGTCAAHADASRPSAAACGVPHAAGLKRRPVFGTDLKVVQLVATQPSSEFSRDVTS